MTDVYALLRLANGAALHKALARRKLGVSYRTVARWIGEEPDAAPPPAYVPAILEAFGLDATQEAPRPAWAEGLPNEVAVEVVRLLIESPLVGQLADELRQAGWPLGAAPSEGSPEPPGDAGTTPRPSMKRAVRR